jgi:uncharacterized repeat protein (TIGR01451 family)
LFKRILRRTSAALILCLFAHLSSALPQYRLFAQQAPGTWTLTGSLIAARYQFTATLLNNGKVLIAGGTGETAVLASAELYDPATGVFTATGSLNTARDSQTATLLNNGTVLIVGGFGASVEALASAELYDPATGLFTPTGSLNTGRDDHTATLLNNGMVLITAGQDQNEASLASAELYDPTTGVFTVTGSMTTARAEQTARLLNDRMVLIAGGVGEAGVLESAELYDPTTGVFTVTGSMTTARYGQTATLLNNGTVLIVAGVESAGSAELYNPATGLFTATGGLNLARAGGQTATLLNNGMVLIAGGIDNSGNQSTSAELYDPGTGIFTVTGSLNFGRNENAATLLTNGMVLVEGAGDEVVLASAELYEPATLVPSGLVSISVGPSNPTIPLGTAQRFIATGVFSDGSTETLTSVTCSSSNNAVASLTNDATNLCAAFGATAGTTTVTACTGSVCGSTLLTVGPATTNFTFEVELEGTSVGTVVGNATPQINCADISGPPATGTCSTTYPSGTAVILTATPGPGAVFAGWGAPSGTPCTVSGATCSVTVTQDEQITATFNTGTTNFTINVIPNSTPGGTGGGIVTGTNGTGTGAIDCDMTGTTETGECSQTLVGGSLTTLTAEPNSTSNFAGWNGVCTVVNVIHCIVNVGGNQTISALFTSQQSPFAVSITGNGSVTSTSSPTIANEINCANPTPPSVCSTTFVSGTSVTLTATPATGQVFTGWTAGPCNASPAATCTFTISPSIPSAAAAFAANTFLLTVNRAGNGGGTVTSNAVNPQGGGITCGPAAGIVDCSVNATFNAPVVLTETPPTGSTGTFSGTPTACVVGGGGTTCSFNMPAALETVTVTFTTGSAIPPALAITKTHTGNFTQGQQGATYTVTVSNGANAGPTSGTVTVTDTIPSGLTLVSMAGTNWTCASNSCERSDGLLAGASYQVITVTVNVAGNAAASVTNSVSASGGGSPTANATDLTTISPSGMEPGIWTLTGSLNTARNDQTATLLNNGTVLIAGGFDNSANAGIPLASAELYNATTGVFTATGSSNTAFAEQTATLLNNGTVLIVQAGNAELYNPATGTFALTANSTTAGTAQTATLLKNGMVLITGGEGSNGHAVANAELYDPATETFTPTGSMNAARDSHTATLLGNGMVLIAAGFDFDIALASAELYDPATGTFTLTGSLNTARSSQTATLLNNGMVLIAGGFSFPDSLASAELYNPATGTFALTGSLITARTNHRTALLNNGTVLITGGLTGSSSGFSDLSSAEIYDPSSGTFAATASMNAARDLHTATLLNDGSVLVTGGSQSENNCLNCGAIAGAELYQPSTLVPLGLVSISLSPDNPTISVGATQRFIATGNFDGSTQTLASVTWSSSNNAVAGVTNDMTNLGAAFGAMAGTTTVTACTGSVCGSTLLTVAAAQSADLGLTMTQSANPVTAGSNETYTLTVTNAGPNDATNTTVSDTLPTNATLVSATPSQGAACSGTAVLTCNLGTVANAGHASVTIVVTVNAGATGAVVNNASVTSDLPDPNPGNNTASATATIGASTNVTLVITPAGNGTGTVKSVPTGINCGTACSFSFASGTQVTLTATAANGSTFTGWGAGPCEGTGTCTITLTSPPTTVTVVANFALTTITPVLTVHETGTGTGTVTSSPAGINCPTTTCSASFTSGTTVILTATADDGSTFAGWSGVTGCPGTGTCTVTVSASETVTATFNIVTSPVTIGVAPGSPSTVVTTPGSSAVFGLTLTSLPGVTGTVTLGCTSSSPNITCNIVPSSITLTGKAINVAIVVNTFCKGAVPAFGPSLPGGLVGGLGMLLASMSLCGALWTFKKRPRLALSFGVLVLVAVGMSACSNLPKSPGGTATQPGLYPLVVTATAPNGAVSSVNLTLNVSQ